MKTKVTTNKEQQLYIFHSGSYYSCLGFDYMEGRKEKLSKELNEPFTQHRKGSLASYNEYKRLLEVARKRNAQTGWRSQSDLIPEFIGREGQRVEVVDKYGEKRRFYIGKSTGFIPCHLEISKSNSNGGGSVTGHPFKSLTFLHNFR